jgi:hypothetical protein
VGRDQRVLQPAKTPWRLVPATAAETAFSGLEALDTDDGKWWRAKMNALGPRSGRRTWTVSASTGSASGKGMSAGRLDASASQAVPSHGLEHLPGDQCTSQCAPTARRLADGVDRSGRLNEPAGPYGEPQAIRRISDP